MIGLQQILREQLMDLCGVISAQAIFKLRPVRKHFQGALGDVRERAVAQIMHQSRQAHQPLILIREPKNFAEQTRDVKNPERVIEAGMQCTRIDQVGESKLMRMPLSL